MKGKKIYFAIHFEKWKGQASTINSEGHYREESKERGTVDGETTSGSVQGFKSLANRSIQS